MPAYIPSTAHLSTNLKKCLSYLKSKKASPLLSPSLKSVQVSETLQSHVISEPKLTLSRACVPCRKKKVGCDLRQPGNTSEPPCHRCRQEKVQCYFSAPTNLVDSPEASNAVTNSSQTVIGPNGQALPSLRDLACPHCSLVFLRDDDLRLHLRTQCPEKHYVCTTCHARFKRLNDLDRHCRIHTGERPHKCEICRRTFSRATTLTRHKQGPEGCAGRRADIGRRRLGSFQGPTPEAVPEEPDLEDDDESIATESRKASTATIDSRKDSTVTFDSRKDSIATIDSRKASMTTTDSRKWSTTTMDSRKASTATVDSRKASSATMDSRKPSTGIIESRKTSTVATESRNPSIATTESTKVTAEMAGYSIDAMPPPSRVIEKPEEEASSPKEANPVT